MTTTWRPPLPTIGRAGPKIDVLLSSTLLERLEEYYGTFRSVPDVFERRISPSFQERCLRARGAPRYLSEFLPGEQLSILLRNLYFKVSASSRMKMKRVLYAGGLHQVRSWFQTADAVCLPLLIIEEHHSRLLEQQVDCLTNWAIENCAHNYAKFQSDLKSLKKAMRKHFALRNTLEGVPVEGHMIPYLRAAQHALSKTEIGGPADLGRFVLLWCQTRATGIADHQMIRNSFEKFKATVSDPGLPVTLDPSIVRKVCRPALFVSGESAKVSCGTTACLEMTRAKGGKTEYLKKLANTYSVTKEYDFRTLDSKSVEPRPVRSAEDLVHWAIRILLEHPTYSACIRVHAVAEPSKARTITVAPYAYQVIMGVFAHIFQPSLQARQIKSGLKADRHLWRFLTDVLNPQNQDWQELISNQIYGLSTDLSEATDWGNRHVARQIWHGLITAAERPGFPLGLALLAKSRYCGKRFAFIPDETNQNFELVVLQRGWMMGDMMTKVILTLSHQYCCVKSGLRVYTLVGDDEIALDHDRELLERHLETLGQIFKVSEADTFVSTNMIFYCEEGSLVPQKVQDTPHVRMRRGLEMDYLDYPRLRLLLPQPIETDAYSMTNIGRFALLGKESRWVSSSYDAQSMTVRVFKTASLLQHLLVPQDSDTICPYTPIEIGGDGAFPFTERFMSRVVEDKARDPREVKFRLSSLLNDRFSHKFVRSDRLDKVVNKHHLYLPKIEGMKALLGDAVITPQTPLQDALMRSLRLDAFKDPQAVFFDIAKGLYYQSLLQGKNPVEPVFNIDRSFTGGHTHEPTIDYQLLLDTWKNPGFSKSGSWGYYVDVTRLPRLNPMNLGWKWDRLGENLVGTKALWEDYIRENGDLITSSTPELFAFLREAKPLPPRVVNRLNLVFESDSYILTVLDRDLANKPHVGLVTRDQRLTLLVKRKLDAWNPKVHHTVYCVDPAIYMIGRVEDANISDATLLEDPGAMLHVDYTEFDDGFPLDEAIWDRKIISKTLRSGIRLVTLDYE